MSKSIGLMARFALVPAVVAFALSLSAGNVCTWQGGSGKFSDANWDVAPVSGNGDTLVFDTSNGTAITVENDLGDDFELGLIKTASGTGFKSFGQVTLTGKSLYFDKGASWGSVVIEAGTDGTNRGAPMQFDMPLRFKSGRIKMSNTFVYNGKITIDDDCQLSIGWSARHTADKMPVTFNGEIYGPNADCDITPGDGGHGSKLSFNGKITLRNLYNNGGYLGGKPSTYFNVAGNKIGTFNFRYNHMIYFPTANALDAMTVIKDLTYGERGMLTFQADQTIDRFVVDGTSSPERYIADKPATVTMKASAGTQGQFLFRRQALACLGSSGRLHLHARLPFGLHEHDERYA